MSLTIYKRGRFYWLRGSVAGITVRESTRVDRKEEAETIRAKREAEIFRQKIYGVEGETTFAHAALSYLEAGKDFRFIEPILNIWKNKKITNIKPGHVQDIARKLYPNAGPATHNRQAITPISAIINFAADRGLCYPIRVKKFSVPKSIRSAIDRDWIDAFMYHGTVPWIGPFALFNFITAARSGETIALAPSHFDYRRKIAVGDKPTKNGDPRIFYLTDELISHVRDLEPRYGRTFGFTSQNGAFRKHWKRTIELAGIQHVTPHEAGRHSFATEAIVRQNKNIPSVAKVGNWKSHSLLSQTYAHPENPNDFAEQVFGTDGQSVQNSHTVQSKKVHHIDFKRKSKKRA